MRSRSMSWNGLFSLRALRALRALFALLLPLGLASSACGGEGKCKTDEDCKQKKGNPQVCYEGRCVSLKGQAGSATPTRGRGKVDPEAVFKVPVDPKKNPIKGPVHAPVTIVEYSDFECPYCGRAAETMMKLTKAFPKALRVAFKHNPLGFHKKAQLAAEASQAVFALKGNDAFWKYHDKLFANRKALGRANLEKWAAELGVDMKKFKKALDDRTYRKQVKKQQAAVQKLGARGAPAFYINGRFVSGARKLPFFKQRVNEALEKAQTILAKGKVKPRKLYEHLIKDGKTKAVYE